MYVSKRWLGAAVTGAVVAVVAVGAVAAGGAPAPPHGVIVVSSTRSPVLHDEIWVLDVRTGVRRNLSRNVTTDRFPAGSPDGKLVAFVSDRGGRDAVWIARPDGTGLRRMPGPTDPHGGVGQPQWSPRGDALAFVGTQRRTSKVWIVRLDGGAVRRFGSGEVWDPEWSPDGRALAVGEGAYPNRVIGVYRADGVRLWRAPGWSAEWSPSGELAVAGRDRTTIRSAEGHVRARLAGTYASWSPDGRVLAMDDPYGVRLVTRAGKSVTRVRGVEAGWVEWAPDGHSFVTFDARNRLIRATLDGRRTVVSAHAYEPSWSSRGELLTAEGNGLVLRGSSGMKHFPLPALDPGRCSGSVLPVGWLDRDHVLLAGGLDGQMTAELWFADPVKGVTRRFAGGPGSEAAPAWSPDGKLIAFVNGDVIVHANACAGLMDASIDVARADGTHRRALTVPGKTPRTSTRPGPPTGRRSSCSASRSTPSASASSASSPSTFAPAPSGGLREARGRFRAGRRTARGSSSRQGDPSARSRRPAARGRDWGRGRSRRLHRREGSSRSCAAERCG